MELKEFKKALKQVGVSYELVRQRTEEQHEELARRVDSEHHASDVLQTAFIWEDAPEGHVYWGKVDEKLLDSSMLAPEGHVCDYSVYKKGKNLKVGCQIITPKQQKRMFKLLADQLGYEIEG